MTNGVVPVTYIILYGSIFRLTILYIYMSSVLALQCSNNLAMKTHNIESRPIGRVHHLNP